MSEESFLFVHSAVDDAGFTPSQFRLLAHLSRRAGADGSIYSSTENMAQTCGMHPRTVKKTMRELRSRDVIASTFRQGQTTLQRINPPDKWKANPVQKTTPVKKVPRSKNGRRGGTKNDLGGVQKSGREGVQNLSPKGNPLKGNPSKGIPPKEIQAAGADFMKGYAL